MLAELIVEPVAAAQTLGFPVFGDSLEVIDGLQVLLGVFCVAHSI